ncbi:hypothetical protein GCM10011297_25540 [Bacterioplanes sanyensis]|uniref:hypothetical protein n=1 Tax=Bacterioplanes sanyensis TaxID=1249553 RepID=UPI00167A1EFD|nr:hypothetical protein [Bacterioplanes sanyensis]GGY51688.1 hypothetical protein GCM10011297_25540 [Bacterioplanes sanyensis]
MKWLWSLCALGCLVACSPSEDAESVQNVAAKDEQPAPTSKFVPQSKQEEWKAQTAEYLFRTLKSYNFEYAAQNYVTVPDEVLRIKDNAKFTGDYRVKAVNDQGVVMGMKGFCYPELDVQIYMVQKGQRYYVEFERTMSEMMSKNMRAEPLRQYCYEFKNQPLQGTIMSDQWTADRVEAELLTQGERSKLTVDVLDKNCEQYPDCRFFPEQQQKLTYVLSLGALDFSGAGGNLGGKHYIAINGPGFSTINRHDGSYRITRLENGMMRLELSVPEYESTGFNGYIDFKFPTRQ